MSRLIPLLFVLLAASPAGLALDAVVSKAAAAGLVRDAVASHPRDWDGGRIAVRPWSFYWAPDFITLSAEVYSRTTGNLAVLHFAVNPWTGDVWEPFGCTRITSPALQRRQEAIWRRAKLPNEARRVLQERAPGCVQPQPRAGAVEAR